MEDDCLIIGNVTKSRKLDETINIVDEENDFEQPPKKIKNPFKVKKSKSKKRKCRADSSTGERNDSAIIKSNFLASYVSDGMNYSISETEIHHLANGVKLASRGVNTEQQPAVVNTCCCQNGHQEFKKIRDESTRMCNDTPNKTSHYYDKGSIIDNPIDDALHDNNSTAFISSNCGEYNKSMSFRPPINKNQYEKDIPNIINHANNIPSSTLDNEPVNAYPSSSSASTSMAENNSEIHGVQSVHNLDHVMASAKSNKFGKSKIVNDNVRSFGPPKTVIPKEKVVPWKQNVNLFRHAINENLCEKAIPWMNNDTNNTTSSISGMAPECMNTSDARGSTNLMEINRKNKIVNSIQNLNSVHESAKRNTHIKSRTVKENSRFPKHQKIVNPNDKVVAWLQKDALNLESPAFQRNINEWDHDKSHIGESCSPAKRTFSLIEKQLLIKLLFGANSTFVVDDVNENTIKALKIPLESNLKRPIQSIVSHWCNLLKPIILAGLHGKLHLDIHLGLFSHLIREKCESLYDIKMDNLLQLWPYHNEKSLMYLINQANNDKRVPSQMKLYEKLTQLLPHYKHSKSNDKQREGEILLNYYQYILQSR